MRIPLAKLNEFLRQRAVVPQTIALPPGTTYDMVRSADDVSDISALIGAVVRQLRPKIYTQRLTRLAIGILAGYGLAASMMILLGLLHSIDDDASGRTNLFVWSPATLSLAIVLALKAAIYLRTGD